MNINIHMNSINWRRNSHSTRSGMSVNVNDVDFWM